jgi:hypothetical protein
MSDTQQIFVNKLLSTPLYWGELEGAINESFSGEKILQMDLQGDRCPEMKMEFQAEEAESLRYKGDEDHCTLKKCNWLSAQPQCQACTCHLQRFSLTSSERRRTNFIMGSSPSCFFSLWFYLHLSLSCILLPDVILS